MWITLRRLSLNPYSRALSLVASLPLAVAAQNAAPSAASGPAPTPCADAADRRRFDFWIGEW